MRSHDGLIQHRFGDDNRHFAQADSPGKEDALNNEPALVHSNDCSDDDREADMPGDPSIHHNNDSCTSADCNAS